MLCASLRAGSPRSTHPLPPARSLFSGARQPPSSLPSLPAILQRIVVVNRSAAQEGGRLHDSYSAAEYDSRYKGGAQ